MPSIVAVMGFDWRHVVRCVLRIGFKKITAIHLVMPIWPDERAERGVEEIRKISEVAGLPPDRVSVHRVDPTKFTETVFDLSELLSSVWASEGDILVSLGGGMRALVVETFIAALAVHSRSGARIRFVIDLEGREDFVEFTAEDVLIVRRGRPSGKELEVLRLARDGAVVTPKRVSEVLNIPRSTAHYILDSLRKEGYLRKVGRGKYVITSLGRAAASVE